MKKVLIVDDEPLLLELLETRLKSRYQVISAFNGEEAKDLALKLKPDLILSDILMPKMDGYQLFQTLQSHVETRQIPFVILSAVQDTQSLFRAKEIGITDYLMKPIHLDDLPDILGRYITSF